MDRLGILGGDVAGGLAEGDLVPAVLIVVEAGHLAAVDGEGGGGVVVGSAAKPNGLGELHAVVLA